MEEHSVSSAPTVGDAGSTRRVLPSVPYVFSERIGSDSEVSWKLFAKKKNKKRTKIFMLVPSLDIIIHSML